MWYNSAATLFNYAFNFRIFIKCYSLPFLYKIRYTMERHPGYVVLVPWLRPQFWIKKHHQQTNKQPYLLLLLTLRLAAHLVQAAAGTDTAADDDEDNWDQADDAKHHGQRWRMIPEKSTFRQIKKPSLKPHLYCHSIWNKTKITLTSIHCVITTCGKTHKFTKEILKFVIKSLSLAD